MTEHGPESSTVGAGTLRIDDHARVRQAERTATRTIEGQALVVVIDDQKLHTLNAVGTVIWNRADGRTFGEIADGIVEEFEVDRDTAVTDAAEFVRQLAELGALEIEGGGE